MLRYLTIRCVVARRTDNGSAQYSSVHQLLHASPERDTFRQTPSAQAPSQAGLHRSSRSKASGQRVFDLFHRFLLAVMAHRSPAPTPGSPRCAGAAATASVRSASASFDAGTVRLRDRPDTPVCGSLPRHPAATTHAAADSRSAASPAPVAPLGCATQRLSPSPDSDNC